MVEGEGGRPNEQELARATVEGGRPPFRRTTSPAAAFPGRVGPDSTEDEWSRSGPGSETLKRGQGRRCQHRMGDAEVSRGTERALAQSDGVQVRA